jgi:hypothetical protein
MIAKLSSRVGGMSREEISWRARTFARTRAQHLVSLIRTPRWRRDDISQALAVNTLPDDVRAAIAEGNWQQAHDGMFEVLRRRPARFVLDPAAAGEVRREVLSRWPGSQADAVRRADAVLDGRFDLLGYRGLSFGEAGAIDWHLDPVHGRRVPMQFWSRVPYLDPEWGDHKVIWEINRQQHWFALSRALWLTGDARYGDAMVRELSAWLAANPPLMGANWASMLELAFRSLSWVWGLHAMLATEAPPRGPWLVDLFVALDRQLTHVEQNLSRYFSPNTHLTGEALALYVSGVALPEMAASARWIDTGRRVLLEEIERQIEPDGGHVERSTHYHRYTLDFYLLALLTARRSGDLDAEARFAEAVERLAPFALAMADGNGRLPRIGDDDAGRLWPITGRDSADVRDSLALAAAVLNRPALAPWGATEESAWISPRRTTKVRPADGAGANRRGVPATEVFPDTGFITVKTGDGDHLVVDVGPHGYLNGGHAHADALAIILGLRGNPLLVDVGTPTYTMDLALRDRLRSSSSHNTVTIDGRSSSLPAGPFQWETRADGRLEVERHNRGFTFVEASHDGYYPVRHRRLLFAGEGGYLVADQVLGEGRHEAAAHWHFDPRWQVACETGQCLRAVHQDGDVAWLLHDIGSLLLVNGDDESQLGWYSPAYGTRVPTWTARIAHEDTAPFTMLTWCGAGVDVPALERLRVEHDQHGEAIAARMRQGQTEWVTLLRPAEPASRETRTCAAGEYHTNARALQYALAAGGLASLSAADLSHVLALRDGLLSLAADHVVPDLHLKRGHERLDLSASTPPTRLRLQGATVAGVTTITLNGRYLPPRQLARRDTIVIAGGDWADPRTADREPGTEHEPRTQHAEA